MWKVWWNLSTNWWSYNEWITISYFILKEFSERNINFILVLYLSFITNFKGSGVVDPGWPCPICTLVNPSNVTMCSACTSERDGSTSYGEASQPSPTASPSKRMKRQKSIPVESRRMRDEKQAKEQWTNIVQYCKSVRKNTALLIKQHSFNCLKCRSDIKCKKVSWRDVDK